jgi:hypothetical protein
MEKDKVLGHDDTNTQSRTEQGKQSLATCASAFPGHTLMDTQHEPIQSTKIYFTWNPSQGSPFSFYNMYFCITHFHIKHIFYILLLRTSRRFAFLSVEQNCNTTMETYKIGTEALLWLWKKREESSPSNTMMGHLNALSFLIMILSWMM